MSVSEESEISNSESNFNIQDEESDGDNSEWDDDLVMKKDPEEVKKDHKSWRDKTCGNIQEESKFIVFESKIKELFARYVRCPNCGKNVQPAKLTTKGSDCHGYCEQPVHWQTQPFVRSMGAGN